MCSRDRRSCEGCQRAKRRRQRWGLSAVWGVWSKRLQLEEGMWKGGGDRKSVKRWIEVELKTDQSFAHFTAICPLLPVYDSRCARCITYQYNIFCRQRVAFTFHEVCSKVGPNIALLSFAQARGVWITGSGVLSRYMAKWRRNDELLRSSLCLLVQAEIASVVSVNIWDTYWVVIFLSMTLDEISALCVN